MRLASWNHRQILLTSSLVVIALLAACGSGKDEPNTLGPTTPPAPTQPVPTVAATIAPIPTVTEPVSPTPAVSVPVPTTIGEHPTPITPSVTSAPAASPTSGPTPEPDNTPAPPATPLAFESGHELVNEKLGVLQLRPGLGVASEYSPGVSGANFRIQVEFSNPFHPEFSPWNYGVKFRNDGQTFQMFMFDQRGNLNQINGNGSELEIVRTVAVPNMLTGGGDRNGFTFLVIEDKAFILLEQALIGVFNVSEPGRVGDISLVTDVFNQTVVVGANTEFFGLVINSAGLAGFTESGELESQQPFQPATGDASLPSSASYTRVNFVSPFNAFSGDFSYGLAFRNEELGIDNWLILDDSKVWRHILSDTTGTQTVQGTGIADQLQTGAGDANLIELLSTGKQHKVYLNGKFLANLVFQPGDFPFTIAPMVAFETDHQTGGMATQFTNFTVWSFED